MGSCSLDKRVKRVLYKEQQTQIGGHLGFSTLGPPPKPQVFKKIHEFPYLGGREAEEAELQSAHRKFQFYLLKFR